MNDIDNLGMISSKMPHSHSTPAGVDGGSRTPPTTPRKAGKMLAVRVQMLDDTITMFQVQAKALGRVLFDQVCKQLHLLEADYFGLEYQEPNGTKYWLDLEKPVCRQVGLSLVDPLLRFCVKFYTPDPGQLEEEFTRYLFCLQIKRDLAQGYLQCNDNTAALMASYIVQAECGDYVIEDYPDHTYLSTYKFVPHQDQELERRIMENHKKHAGQSPAEADVNLLETARRCELYGMKMHPAKDHEGVPLNLAVAHMGIIVFQHYTKINTFSWAKIRKISFKRKRFLIKLHPEGYGYYKDTVEFFFEGRNECKNFWKKCVENHGFFRCSVVKRVIRQKTRVLSRGSSFRYSGKTQKQIVEFVRDNYVKRQTFQRSNSFRQTSGGRALQGSEGGGYRGATPSSSLMGSSSISAHPLLPLGDPALGTPALSLSCGSMTLDSPTTVASVSLGGTSHRRDDTAMSYRTLTSIDVHSPATPSNQSQSHRHTIGVHQQQQQQQQEHQQQRITSSTGRISPSNSSPPEFPPPRPQPQYPWQRSSSCRELYASSFEDSGRARKLNDDKPDGGLNTIQLPSQGELDNPITRYDETNRSYSAASSKLPSLDHDSVPERVYSSSYPGTSSLSTESGHEESGPGADLSHDDLSHDSYELLEREHEFEYPESYSSPREEAVSDQSDEGIEQEMFQMDSETDSFVKHRSIKSTDKQLFKSVLTDIKNAKVKSDRYSATSKTETNNLVAAETRLQRTSTQIERKYEPPRSSISMDNSSKPPLPHLDSIRKDPVVLQVQKQKLTVLNEIKNLKPKYKITHVDSEVLRDEGIMRPKSRIDDDLSPVETNNRTIIDQARERTTRARSIVSLEDYVHRPHVETGSLGRNYRDKKLEKIAIKERKSFEREERKRIERENSREIRRLEKSDSRERRSMGRMDSRERRSMERLDLRDSVGRNDSREMRRSIERLDSRERSYEKLDSRDRNGRREYRDSREMRKSLEHLDRSPKERTTFRHHDTRESRRERSFERLDSRESRKSSKIHDYERHTLERFDSGNKSPFDRQSPRELRGKSYERLDSRDRPTFDFDPSTIERLSSLDRINTLEKYDSVERPHDKKNERRGSERKNYIKQDSRERKSFERKSSAESLDRASLEGLDSSFKNNNKKDNDELPRDRDDWRSLERARKEEERRERERQAKVFLESRTETIIGVPNEWESVKPKSGFSEYDPKVVGGVIVGFDDGVLASHIPVERTKSDPNPGRQRIGSNSKRHILMHQKSIDLTPADSGDEDAFSDGTSNRKANTEIPYTLHKRHVMNGTASDEKSESDSGKNSKISKTGMELPKLPIKQVTDVSLLDLTKLPPTPTPISISKLSPDRPKSILISPDKSKSPKLLSPKLSPTEPQIIHIPCEKSPPPGILKSPSRTPTKLPSKSSSLDKVVKGEIAGTSSTEKKYNKLSPTDPSVAIISVIEKRSPKKSPIDPHITIVSVIEKRKASTDISPRDSGSERSPSKIPLNFADVVVEEMKQEQQRRKQSGEKQQLKVPDDSLEKQDSIEKIPLPEIPVKITKPSSPVKSLIPSKDHFTLSSKLDGEKTESEIKRQSPKSGTSPKKTEKQNALEKPSIPEKTKRILDRIESRFSEINKNSSTKIPRPKIIDTGHDDFVDPIADLPLDDVPVKPAFELDSLKVPEFNPFMLRPHAEPLRSKSLSLAEEKAPIDTLLSPEVENKVFIQDVSPKRIKKAKSEPKKDFKKQSKSLEGDKPPLKKSSSKEARLSPSSSKIDKSKLKLGEMPQEIIIIDSTDVEPEISIVQKGRSKSVTRLTDRSFSTSKDEEPKKPRGKSASVDDELIKGLGGLKNPDKQRPKSLGISKSLGSTERESLEKVSPKKMIKGKSMDGKISPSRRSPSRSPATRSPVEPKETIFIEESIEEVIIKEAEEENEKISEEKNKKHEEPKEEQKKLQQIMKKMDETEDKRASNEVESLEKIESRSDESKSLSRQKTIQSPIISRKPGEAPMLFARARLGLSEGSGIGALQRQGATQSPTSQRRAKSLDAPVVSLHKLPPANAFSSKDDTVEEPEDPILSEINERKEEVKQITVMEVSPNHRSDSTDYTMIPTTTDSSMTEPSTQYLESPLEEFQGITACPDLIPYEQEWQSTIRRPSKEISDGATKKVEPATRFIDQSSIESSTEPDIVPEPNEAKSTAASMNVKKIEAIKKYENSSGTDSSDGEKKGSEQKIKTIGSSLSITTDEATPRGSIERDEVPNVTVSIVEEITETTPIDYFHVDDIPDMVKSPIQISIEECSDAECSPSDDQNETLDQVIIQAKQTEKPRLDSGDTSEDTLDALDAQMQMNQGPDSDLSSPDYADRMDEKTLVEVELTPEYLEMRKEDMEGAEELPEDEPSKDRDYEDNNKLFIDKKYRLSTERSRSEETNTYTPDREDPDSSSCSIARPLGIGQIQPIFDRREINAVKESRKEGSVEEESSSSSHPQVKIELSSTWKPFPLESSGSSSLEDAGWMPQDDNNHHQSHSEDSNGPNEDSYQEDLAEFAGALPYPINSEIMANYGAFALSRTLSRISERSTTSEQDKSDLEDSFKPSSRSPSLDDESLISSDHQPSLSSDPPSGTALPSVSDDRRTSSELPDIPIDVPHDSHEDPTKSPRNRRSRLAPQTSEDWPSPPSSPLFDTAVCSHVETFYMEIKPEEAVKVTVTDSTDTPRAVDSDSSDENRTLHDDLHSTLLEDGQSSTSATTVDGTVKIAVKPKSNSYITGSSHSEDTSMGLSMSEWSSSNNTVRQFCQYSGTKSDDNSLAELGASISDWSGSTTVVVIPQQYYAAMATEKSQSDTTTSEKSEKSMRPNSKCQHVSPSSSRQDLHVDDDDGGCGYNPDENLSTEYPPEIIQQHDEFDEARKFVESQFDEHRRRFEDDQSPSIGPYTDISPPQIKFNSEYGDEEIDEDIEFGALPSIPGSIPEEDEEERLYDNVPAMKYSSGDNIRMKVSPGDSSEDMHERFADIASRSRSGDDEWSFEDSRGTLEEDRRQFKSLHKFDRGYSEPGVDSQKHGGTRSTQRPVVVPIRAKSTPYYSTTSLSGESTTSSPPMPIRAQIRTKTIPYTCRSPQSEGDTSSSMDSPAHTPDRAQRAFRRKRQQNAKRRHRVAMDVEIKDGQIVSSTDSSFDVTTIPPPLLPEMSIDIEDDEQAASPPNLPPRNHQNNNDFHEKH